MSPGKVFFYVQHLLGIGHLKRSLLLANALAQAGWQVTVASGGHEVAWLQRSGLHWVQLPPASAADLSFKQLIGEDGQPVDDAWKERRKQCLLEAWDQADADVLLIELFPFGRRQMRFELLPLLERARAGAHPPLVVSSIRDILGGGKGDMQRQQKMLAAFDRHFDHVLAHGDPNFIALDTTFALTPALGSRLHYTGYVVDPATTQSAPGEAGRDEVLVSAGGGAVGMPLLEAAIRARPLTQLGERTWRLLTGENLAEEQYKQLIRLAGEMGQGRVVIERSRSDFVAMLGRCALSISQGGYNTVLELLSQGARAVVAPFSAGGSEIEQTMRARLLASKGCLICVEEDALTPKSLAAAVDQAMQTPPLPAGQILLNGAQQTVALMQAWLYQRRGLDKAQVAA